MINLVSIYTNTLSSTLNNRQIMMMKISKFVYRIHDLISVMKIQNKRWFI